MMDELKLVIYESGMDDELTSLMIEHTDDFEYVSEATDFNVFPKFKTMTDRYPELEKYKGLVSEAAKILDDSTDAKNPAFKNFGYKAFKVIAKIIKVIFAIDSVICLPFCIFIFPLIGYFWDRLWVWALENAEVELTKSQMKMYIEQLRKLKKITDDKKLAKLCDDQIEKLTASLKKIQDQTSHKVTESSEDVKTAYNTLRLRIYESGCDDDDKELMLSALESVNTLDEFKSAARDCIKILGE